MIRSKKMVIHVQINRFVVRSIWSELKIQFYLDRETCFLQVFRLNIFKFRYDYYSHKIMYVKKKIY